DAASGACGRFATGDRENDTSGRIREHFADKLTYKDGAGLPPQGRTVRAGVALPPGGARLLFWSLWFESASVAAQAFGTPDGRLVRFRFRRGIGRGSGEEGVEQGDRAPLGERVVGVTALR